MNILLSVALQAVGAYVLVALLQRLARRLFGAHGISTGRPRYVPYDDPRVKPGRCLAVDSPSSTAAKLDSITHHKGSSTPLGLLGDTSTDAVLRAIELRHPLATRHALLTADHFDIDSFVCVWALQNPELAMRHGQTLRALAALGDFRESSPTAPGRRALQLACWLNSTERSRFYRPYAGAESDPDGAAAKFAYFLDAFGPVLESPPASAAHGAAEWAAEYAQVMDGLAMLKSPAAALHVSPSLGLATVSAPQPTHYYALFAGTAGVEAVACVYPGRRYELEYKYTGFVRLFSRPVFPRLDLAPLVARLNFLEATAESEAGVAWAHAAGLDSPQAAGRRFFDGVVSGGDRTGSPCGSPAPGGGGGEAAMRKRSMNLRASRQLVMGSPRHAAAATSSPAPAAARVVTDGGLRWGAAAITDSGPLLRLDPVGAGLTKAERYGHPCERVIHASALAPTDFVRQVEAFLAHGLAAAGPPRKGGWSWAELKAIQPDWEACAWPPLREPLALM